jgi:pimeloyl-ACP methyl ester carboxylesterase
MPQWTPVCQTAPVVQAYRSPRGRDEVQGWCRAVLAGWEVAHRDREIESSLGPTHVTTLGVGERTCVFLPGTNFNVATSVAFLRALATRFSVVAADLPGQPGLSAAGRPRDEVAGYTRWVNDLLDWVAEEFPDSPVLLAGHSRGAAIALDAEPGSVGALALLSPAGFTDVRPTLPMLRATLPWLVRRDATGARRLLRLMSGPGHEPAPALIEWMALVARACRTTGAPGRNTGEVLARWRGREVTVVVGDHDAFFPLRQLRKACLAAVDVEPVVVEDAGHLLIEEEHDQVAALLAGD